MSQQYVTDSGTQLTVPGAYAEAKVENPQNGIPALGVVALVAEAEDGPSFAEEAKLSLNYFSPTQEAAVRAKYKSGPLVDAFVNVIAASADEEIQGAPQSIILVKTNTGTKASSTLSAIGGGTYASLKARRAGKAGNMITRTVTVGQAEVVPSTGAMLICPPQVNTDVAFRANGGAAVTASLTAGMLPTAAVAAIEALSGITASGGTNRSLITSVAGSVTMTQDSGMQCHLDITTAWANVPQVGDLVYIPTGSPLATANEGSYVVLAASTTRLDLYKLLDAAGAGSAVTAPSTEGPIAIAATTNVQAFAPVVVALEASNAAAGLGKSLEINQTATGSFQAIAKVFASATSSPPAAAATFVSASGSPKVIKASKEYGVVVNVARQADSYSEDVTINGEVVLTLGYTGTTATATIANGVLTTTVVGGTGTNLNVTLADFATVADLVTYLNSQTGYNAAAATGSMGQRAPSTLDAGTYGIATTHGAATGRIKADGAKFAATFASGQGLLDATPPGVASNYVGLPAAAAIGFCSGGGRGGTTNADIANALLALERVRCNFVVTCFAQDATQDIADGETVAGSTYEIAAIHAALRAHVTKMSTPKRRRARQGACGFKGTFQASKDAAGNLALGRIYMGFLNVTALTSEGSLKVFQPWMEAVKAIGMQAAGGYRPIVLRYAQVSGVSHVDFDMEDEGMIEDALKHGLNPLVPDPNGGYKWSSDQTTYTRDTNWVFNSLQAIYVADLVTETARYGMELAHGGKSSADTSASLAKTTLEGILDNAVRLKWLAPSDDAPRGFDKVQVLKTGPALVCSARIKVAGATYFISLTFTVSQVSQSA